MTKETKQDVFDAAVEKAIGMTLVAGYTAYGDKYREDMQKRYAAASDGDPQCPYCHYSGLDNAVPWLPDTLAGTVAGVSLYPPSLLVNVEGVNTRIPIHFCPMCGRSLGETK